MATPHFRAVGTSGVWNRSLRCILLKMHPDSIRTLMLPMNCIAPPLFSGGEEMERLPVRILFWGNKSILKVLVGMIFQAVTGLT